MTLVGFDHTPLGLGKALFWKSINGNYINYKKENENMIQYEKYENLNEYIVVVGLPGFSKEDISINIKNRCELYIDVEENGIYEKKYGKLCLKKDDEYDLNTDEQLKLNYTRLVIDLPEAINNNVATMKDGLLTIVLEKESKAKKIEIK